MRYPNTFTDQLGRMISLSKPPQRIVSLVPSQTELLHDLGLDRAVVGITKFCIDPEHWRAEKKIVGGTKNFDFSAIEALQPDLVIGNKEENYKEGINRLAAQFPVWMSDIANLEDALDMIRQVGIITDRSAQADVLANEIAIRFTGLHSSFNQTVLYVIWRGPWMAAGTDTFINEMLRRVGLRNCLTASRYPELTDKDITDLNPDIIFLSSEPYPFQEKHIEELRRILPNAKIVMVDGEMFSWYGSRLLKTPAYLQSLSRDLESK